MNRRTFIGWIAKAAVGAVALKVIPASALPKTGELHDAIRDTCIGKVRKAIADWRSANKPHWRLKGVDANPDFWDQMSDELRANQRITFLGTDSIYWDNLMILGVPVYSADRVKEFGFRLVVN